MTKIIKPLLNADGTQVQRLPQKEDWYYIYSIGEFRKCDSIYCNIVVPIYYEEKWKPKENEFYWFYCFSFSNPVCTVFNSSNIYDDTKRLSLGNCFQTKEEAEDINNILKVLDNMKKYYQDKQQEAK